MAAHVHVSNKTLNHISKRIRMQYFLGKVFNVCGILFSFLSLTFDVRLFDNVFLAGTYSLLKYSFIFTSYLDGSLLTQQNPEVKGHWKLSVFVTNYGT